jgi:hypothetical protein
VHLLLVLSGVVACDRGCPLWYLDRDGDGYGDAGGEGERACEGEDVPGRVDNALDCADSDPERHPGAGERCDPEQIDDDCDGRLDDADDDRIDGIPTWADADGDGYGDLRSEPIDHCAIPDGRSSRGEDCDDSSAETFPGAAELETGCRQDEDGDGYGAVTPAGATTQPGTDCDDTSASIHPGAHELFGDGWDQDCDTIDPWVLFDDFEAGAASPEVWAPPLPSAQVVDIDGDLALELASDTVMQTVSVDTSACEHLLWHYEGKPEDEDGPVLQFFDGAGWVDLDRWPILEDPPRRPQTRWGLLPASAFHPQLSLRFVTPEPFLLDDFRLSCSGPDADGDGIGTRDDCDDSAEAHWFDCGLCVDSDADGYGRDCDLGEDCEDTEPGSFPGNPDLASDGLDDDCNGYDGPSLYDDFEAGTLDPAVWDSMSGALYSDNYVHRGRWALQLSEVSEAVSLPFDASLCEQLWWSYWVKRGADAPETDNALVLSWDDGTGWVPFDVVTGNGVPDVTLLERHGVISDPAALWPGLRLRLHTEGPTDPFDDDRYYVDELLVACSGPDSDGDTFPSDRDCDDGDAAHWDDCARCDDADSDGYGARCDLGEDCDDDDSLVHPARADLFGDGLDADCDGFDGETLQEDFELGHFSAALWESLLGAEITESYVASGAYAALFYAQDLVSTLPFDTSACPALLWRFQGQRVTPPPDEEDLLELSYSDGSSWRSFYRWPGTGSRDDEFREYTGVIEDAAALGPDFRLRLELAEGAGGRFIVDDLVVACTERDLDLDGRVGVLDCDNQDPAHWTDCGSCEDSDGDDHGPGCDLGGDCQPDDPAISPGVPDPAGDGLDQDCSGLDGPDLREDFEGDVLPWERWSEYEGAVSVARESGGNHYLELAGHELLASTRKDLSACASLAWSYESRLDSSPLAPHESLFFEWWDGAAWVVADQQPGGPLSTTFDPRSGEIVDPAALAPGFRVRLRTDSQAMYSQVNVDNVTLTCVLP